MILPDSTAPASTAPGARLVELSADHPGFLDTRYRARRDAIARLALDHRAPAPPQRVDYTPEERALWGRVLARLLELHAERADPRTSLHGNALGLGPDHLPQLAEVNARLTPRTGFRFAPVAGLVTGRDFLRRLATGSFLSTQYLRHASRPFYTPEPDLIHELVGHAAALAHPAIAALHRRFGQVARTLHDPADLARLDRLYWTTMEFGLTEHRGRLRAFGAGLLSSCAELEDFETRAEIVDFELGAAVESPYEPSELQPRLFVLPSLEALERDVLRLAGTTSPPADRDLP